MIAFLRLAFPEFQIVELAVRGVLSSLRRAAAIASENRGEPKVARSLAAERSARPRVLD
jgi:hypothetical protein